MTQAPEQELLDVRLKVDSLERAPDLNRRVDGQDLVLLGRFERFLGARYRIVFLGRDIGDELVELAIQPIEYAEIGFEMLEDLGDDPIDFLHVALVVVAVRLPSGRRTGDAIDQLACRMRARREKRRVHQAPTSAPETASAKCAP